MMRKVKFKFDAVRKIVEMTVWPGSFRERILTMKCNDFEGMVADYARAFPEVEIVAETINKQLTVLRDHEMFQDAMGRSY